MSFCVRGLGQISPPYKRRGRQIEPAQRRNLTGVVPRKDLHHRLPQLPGCLVTHMCLVPQIACIKAVGKSLASVFFEPRRHSGTK